MTANQPIIVIGVGGHAKVVLASLQALGADIIGLVDTDIGLSKVEMLRSPVIGDDSAVFMHDPASILLVNGVGSIERPTARYGVFERMKSKGYRFATVVDPHAYVAVDVELGEGSQVMAGAVIQPGCRLGVNSIVSTRASVDHDCSVGAHAHVAPGATLSGGVAVGDFSHIGAGATVRQGISIGSNAVVGIGAAVVSDVAEGATVVGVPARPFIRT